MKGVHELFNDFMGHSVYIVSIPINKVIEFGRKYINNKDDGKKEYIWEYDNQFGKCDCKATYLSEPYCKHYNKLIRREKVL